ncbi:ABA4-like family protein [Winogradskyella sp.]|uniref:ABA4-like family protein n=1 Tax=Winogradskyella sp. TaxID=1883156 RepID=UPI003F6D88E7
MTPSEVFTLVNILAFPMWILMIILPKWKVTRILIEFKIIPLLLAVIYAIYIINSMLTGPAMDFGSLESVMQLFTLENAVLAGWVHYLTFDLLVGMWMLDLNRTLKIHQLLMVPCLIGAFMLGPIGFLVFMIIRSSKVKKEQSITL